MTKPDVTRSHDELLAEVAALRAQLAELRGGEANPRALARDAVAAARHADERFALCVENMLDCFGIFTAMRNALGEITDFRIDYLNGAACANNLEALDQQLGRGLCETLPAHRTNGLFDAYCRVVSTGEPLELESVEYADVYPGDSAPIRRFFTIRAFRLGDGFGCAWRDVTDRHVSERALREREDRLQLALKAGRMGIWEWQVATGAVYWSPDAALQTVGTTAEHHCTLEDFRALVHPDDRDILWHKVQRALRGEEDYQHEFRIYAPSGEVRWVSNAAIVIRDAAGAPVRMVGTVSDITDRRLAMHTLEKRTAELRAAEDQLRQMEEAIPQLIWSTAADGNADYFSAQTLAYTGRTFAELAGAQWADVLHPDDRPAAILAWERATAGVAPYDVEYRLRRHDGVYRWFKARGQPVRDRLGRVIRWWGTCTDIDDQVQTQAALAVARTAAESASAAKDKFLATLSHELRAPLTPILTLSQLLAEDAGVSKEIRDVAAVIQRNTALEVRLIDDLLDLTRIERGKLHLALEPVDAHDQIRHALAICEADIRGKALRLVASLDAPEAHIHADPARLQQVVWNLLKNAVKFTPDGGTIALQTRTADGAFVLAVGDTGIGIEPEKLPTVFDAFEQGGREVTRTYGGLGLGLAISKRLVELMGGQISAASAGRWRGSTFTVTFATCPAPAAQPGGPAPAAGKPRDGQRILLVDDHADTRSALLRLLTVEGFRVREADSVSAAMRCAEAESFDLVISDLGLPDGTGWDLMRQLSARHPVKGIALSGFGMAEDVQKSRAAGFSDHITKPVAPHVLRAALRRLVDSA